MGADDEDEEEEEDESGSDGREREKEEEEEEEESHQADESGSLSSPAKPAGAYDPAEFANLNVSPEIRALFEHIGRYKPHDIELETKLKCFVPDYIPAVGEIDGFTKPDRPDGREEALGVQRLDEPGPFQSDPTVVELQLRALAKKTDMEPTLVRSIENADKRPREIDKWIQSVANLHRNKPAPEVRYSRSMPEIENLMQVWPEEFEELLKETGLPSADMDMSLEEYARLVCAMLDVPVYDSVTQSLHVVFSLYNEFRNNQHFVGMEAAGGGGGGGGAMVGVGVGEEKEGDEYS